MSTLGGSTFVWNGVSQDYCFMETIKCLCELCDEVSIVCGGNDGTVERVLAWDNYREDGQKVFITIIEETLWKNEIGREKLSYFSNMAIEKLTTDYNFYLQCDEILHESSFPFIRQAIEEGQEGFMVTRFNLWSSPYKMLNVAQNRKPCSTEVLRLAKSNYRCVDDAESIGIPNWTQIVSFKYLPEIRIYHMGFVRDKYKHLTKIKHMQEEVFLWEVDKRIHDNKDGFDCWKWGFTPEDVIPITESLPKFIQQWAKERE